MVLRIRRSGSEGKVRGGRGVGIVEGWQLEHGGAQAEMGLGDGVVQPVGRLRRGGELRQLAGSC